MAKVFGLQVTIKAVKGSDLRERVNEGKVIKEILRANGLETFKVFLDNSPQAEVYAQAMRDALKVHNFVTYTGVEVSRYETSDVYAKY